MRKPYRSNPESELKQRQLRAGRISAIEPQAKHPDRFNLYIDDRFALGLSAYVASRVRVGQELSIEAIEELARAEQLEDAHNRALGRLEVRPRSEAEIRRYLSSKKYSKETIDQVVERLKKAHLLSDREFAKFWVENRESFRPRSARALTYELRQKGVPQEEITRVVSKLDEAESAYRAARPKAERWKELDAQEFRDKLSGYLARRGFGYQITRETVSRLWNEQRDQKSSNEELEEKWNPS